MGKPVTFQTDGWAATNTTIRAYIQDDATGINIVPSTVSAIAYTITEAMGPNQGHVYANAVALSPVGSYLNSSLSTTGWTVDSTGWNFLASLPAACFPDAGEYVIDLLFTLAADSSTFPVKCYHHARSRS